MRAIFFSLVCVIPLLGFSYEFASSYEQWIDPENQFVEYCDEVDGARVISMGSGIRTSCCYESRPTSSEAMAAALLLSYLYDNQEMFDKFLRYILFTMEESAYRFRMPSLVNQAGKPFVYFSKKDASEIDSIEPSLSEDLLMAGMLDFASKKVERGEWEKRLFSTAEGDLSYREIYEKMDFFDLDDEEEYIDNEAFTFACDFSNQLECDLLIEEIYGNGTFILGDIEEDQTIEDFVIKPKQTVSLQFTSGNEYYGTLTFQHCCRNDEGYIFNEGEVDIYSTNGKQWYVDYTKNSSFKMDPLCVESLIFKLQRGDNNAIVTTYEGIRGKTKKKFSSSNLKKAWLKELDEIFDYFRDDETNQLQVDLRSVHYPIIAYQPSMTDPLNNDDPCNNALEALFNRAIGEEKVLEIVAELDACADGE